MLGHSGPQQGPAVCTSQFEPSNGCLHTPPSPPKHPSLLLPITPTTLLSLLSHSIATCASRVLLLIHPLPPSPPPPPSLPPPHSQGNRLPSEEIVLLAEVAACLYDLRSLDLSDNPPADASALSAMIRMVSQSNITSIRCHNTFTSEQSKELGLHVKLAQSRARFTHEVYLAVRTIFWGIADPRTGLAELQQLKDVDTGRLPEVLLESWKRLPDDLTRQLTLNSLLELLYPDVHPDILHRLVQVYEDPKHPVVGKKGLTLQELQRIFQKQDKVCAGVRVGLQGGGWGGRGAHERRRNGPPGPETLAVFVKRLFCFIKSVVNEPFWFADLRLGGGACVAMWRGGASVQGSRGAELVRTWEPAVSGWQRGGPK